MDPLTRGRSPFSAVRWVFATSVFQRALGLIGLGIIARLVDKDSFGAYRQLLALHLVATVILPLGFDQLLIREAGDRKRYGLALAGAVAATLACLIAPSLAARTLIARLLGIEQWGALLWWFPVILAVQGVKQSIKPVFVADLAFRRVGTGEALYTFVVMFGGAGFLAMRPGAGSLYLAYGLAEVVELWWIGRRCEWPLFSRPREAWRAFLDRARAHRRFCVFFTLDQVFNNLGATAPVLLLGALAGQAAAGVFAMANILVTLPVLLLAGAMGRVAFPAMAGRSEAELQSRGMLTLRGAAAFIPPVLVWILFFAPMVVRILLGADWVDDAAPMLRWLTLYVIWVGIFSPLSSLDVLRDRPDVSLAWNAVTLAARAAAIFWGAGRSVEAAVAAFSVVSAILWIVYGVMLAWLLRAGYARFFGAWLRFAPLWGVAALLWWVLVGPLGFSGWVAISLSLAPFILYYGLVYWMDREAARLLLRAAAARR